MLIVYATYEKEKRGRQSCKFVDHEPNFSAQSPKFLRRDFQGNNSLAALLAYNRSLNEAQLILPGPWQPYLVGCDTQGQSSDGLRCTTCKVRNLNFLKIISFSV
ncbi:hypothetical protein J6590_019881 [Homalodisca vitripennis]|nr:hypothetical protein J6590_019881 [Homalodisca vitripennis]